MHLNVYIYIYMWLGRFGIIAPFFLLTHNIEDSNVWVKDTEAFILQGFSWRWITHELHIHQICYPEWILQLCNQLRNTFRAYLSFLNISHNIVKCLPLHLLINVIYSSPCSYSFCQVHIHFLLMSLISFRVLMQLFCSSLFSYW